MLSSRWVLASLALLSTTIAATSIHADSQLPFSVDADFVPATSSGPTLADRLTRSKQARLYFDYARDSTLVSTLLSDPSGRATILAPTDSAILALSRRPHQGPLPVVPGSLVGAGGAGGVSSNEEERSAAEWLERWVKGHVVLEEVRLEGEGWEEREYETMEGRKVRFEGSGEGGEGRRLVAEGIEVVGEEQASNGKIIYIAGTLSLD